MTTIAIGSREIGPGHPAFIIAEAGQNHQGDAGIARKLIEEASRCGADAVKFQKRSISRILTREGLAMPYDNANSFGATYGEHKRALELSEDDYRGLQDHARAHNIIFCASGWDEESIDFLDTIGVPFFKMASADLTNLPLLRHAASKGKPVMLSTGMASMDTVRAAYDTVRPVNRQIALLQCTSTYPSRFCEINLNVLAAYRAAFPDAVVGYSGHELGIAIPPAAVALGACIIERHFTLDRTMKGSDHAASLEPGGFAKMVRDIRHVEEAMGSGEKRVQEAEIPIFRKLAKSVVSKRAIGAGAVIEESMLTTKGPGTGLSPAQIGRIAGKKAARDIAADTVLVEADIAW